MCHDLSVFVHFSFGEFQSAESLFWGCPMFDLYSPNECCEWDILMSSVSLGKSCVDSCINLWYTFGQ